MNDYPYHPTFQLADGKVPVTVTFDLPGVRVIRGQGSNRPQWMLDDDLKPISYEHNDKFFLFNGGKLSEITAFEQTTSGQERPVSRSVGGVDLIPAVMANILAASGKPGFPEETAKKIPAAFAALGLALPDRRDPPG